MPPRQTVPPQLYRDLDHDDPFWGLHRTEDIRKLYDMLVQRVDWHRFMSDAVRLHINTQAEDPDHKSGLIDFPLSCGICMVQALMDPYASTSARAKKFLEWHTDGDYNLIYDNPNWSEI